MALTLDGSSGINLGTASLTTNTIIVTSNTVVTNLNADYLDGFHSSAFATSGHAHGNVTNAGYIGTTTTLPIITGTGGILQAGSFGTGAGTFCQGNDVRLSDSRTASDVSAWAKAATKPTYTYSEVGAQVAGSYVTAGGALGTPSSGTLSSCSGMPIPAATTSVYGGIKVSLSGTTLTITV